MPLASGLFCLSITHAHVYIQYRVRMLNECVYVWVCVTSVYYRCWDLALLGETAQKIVILLPLFKSQGLHYRWQVLGVLVAYRKYGQCYTTHQCGLLLLLKEELGVGPMNAHTTPWCRLGTCTDTCTVFMYVYTTRVQGQTVLMWVRVSSHTGGAYPYCRCV